MRKITFYSSLLLFSTIPLLILSEDHNFSNTLVYKRTAGMANTVRYKRKAELEVGKFCKSDSDCYSHNCNGNKCGVEHSTTNKQINQRLVRKKTQFRKDGMFCSSNIDCLSNDCRGGKCGGKANVHHNDPKAIAVRKLLMSDEEFEGLILDKTEEGVEKLIEKFYGKEMIMMFGEENSEKIIGGMAGMFIAHITAPRSAWEGNGKEAVDNAVGPIGAIAGGIIGGPVGAVVGQVISLVPGYAIDYFDTSNVQFYLYFTNISPYHIRFSSHETNYQPMWSVMYAWVPDKYSSTSVDGKLHTHNGLPGYVLPKPVTFRSKEDEVKQVSYTCPMAVHSKWAQVSFQLEAVDDNGNVVKTYDVAFKWPGDYWFEHHYAGIYENASWDRQKPYERDNYEPIDKMKHQEELGENHGDQSGESKAFWKTWNDFQVELA